MINRRQLLVVTASVPALAVIPPPARYARGGFLPSGLFTVWEICRAESLVPVRRPLDDGLVMYDLLSEHSS
jgi:hypothetical protein